MNEKVFLLFNLQQAELTNKATLRDLVKNNEINLSQKVFMKLSEQIGSVSSSTVWIVNFVKNITVENF